MHRLWSAGARVPYPVEEFGHGFFMQYIGTVGQAAPRLSDVRLSKAEATAVFDKLVEELHILARVGVVHGDLSAYNVLLQHGCPWIIDVPQAVTCTSTATDVSCSCATSRDSARGSRNAASDANPKRLGAELLKGVFA